MSDVSVVWFRRDLRLSDNEIVSLATANNMPTIFIFTIDPWFFKQPEIGAARVTFLLESLIELDRNLRRLGSKLMILNGESVSVVTGLLNELAAKQITATLYFNRDVQVKYGLERDAAIRQYCKTNGIKIHEGQAYYLSDNPEIRKDWAKHYYAYQEKSQWHIPTAIKSFRAPWINELEQLQPDQLLEWAKEFIPNLHASPLFSGGETKAQQTLNSFLRERYHGYHWKLSQPYLARHGSTSQLSPHIAFGTISTRQVSAAAYKMKQRLKHDRPEEVKTMLAFLSRLRWRDSFTQRLYFFPDLMWQNQFPEFDKIYRNEALTTEQQVLFEAWKTGTTGFPMLDASMRQLAADGWMNFRMRAQAVTMLCLVFGISWHHGARYFMQQLVDGDIAVNHWQWQMQAGITNPLSPIFRIYNPTKNLIERDPNLKYIHEWLPEYKNCLTHEAVLSQAQPIVDFTKNKKLYGDVVSQIRREVRDRLKREASTEYVEASLLFAATSHLQKQYKASARKP